MRQSTGLMQETGEEIVPFPRHLQVLFVDVLQVRQGVIEKDLQVKTSTSILHIVGSGKQVILQITRQILA